MYVTEAIKPIKLDNNVSLDG